MSEIGAVAILQTAESASAKPSTPSNPTRPDTSTILKEAKQRTRLFAGDTYVYPIEEKDIGGLEATVYHAAVEKGNEPPVESAFKVYDFGIHKDRLRETNQAKSNETFRKEEPWSGAPTEYVCLNTLSRYGLSAKVVDVGFLEESSGGTSFTRSIQTNGGVDFDSQSNRRDEYNYYPHKYIASEWLRNDQYVRMDEVASLTVDVLLSENPAEVAGKASQDSEYAVLATIASGFKDKVDAEKLFIRAIRQVALIEQALNEIGFSLRDLKLGNFYVDQDGGIKIIDVSVAQPISERALTAMGQLLDDKKSEKLRQYIERNKAKHIPSGKYLVGLLYNGLTKRVRDEAKLHDAFSERTRDFVDIATTSTEQTEPLTPAQVIKWCDES